MYIYIYIYIYKHISHPRLTGYNINQKKYQEKYDKSNEHENIKRTPDALYDSRLKNIIWNMSKKKSFISMINTITIVVHLKISNNIHQNGRVAVSLGWQWLIIFDTFCLSHYQHDYFSEMFFYTYLQACFAGKLLIWGWYI